MEKLRVEVCAGSVRDCMLAYEAGADRIELNNALHLGGLTPSYATVKLAKEKVAIPIIAMVRPRGGGFHYNSIELETMFLDAQYLIAAGADGLAFGFLNEDGSIDEMLTKKMVDLCHCHHREAVFHRAIDVSKHMNRSIETLIRCGVDRVLTSGQSKRAIDGIETLKDVQKLYGDKIEVLVGSGVTEETVDCLVEETGVNQVRGSFKMWYPDLTTSNNTVSYTYSNEGDYDGVSLEKIRNFINNRQ